MSDPSSPVQALLTVSLQEYAAACVGMTEATKRIETIRGLYLAGAFALVGALLHSDVGYVGAEVAKIRLDPYLMSTVLLAPLLNSILLIYVASVMHFILAVAKYNTYFFA